MDRVNGSPLIIPAQPVAVELRRALPNGQGVAIAFPAHADPREVQQRDVAINALLVNELLVGLAQAQAQISAVLSQLAVVLVVLDAIGPDGELGDPRVMAARAMLRQIAAQCTIATPAPSALDAIAPS